MHDDIMARMTDAMLDTLVNDEDYQEERAIVIVVSDVKQRVGTMLHNYHEDTGLVLNDLLQLAKIIAEEHGATLSVFGMEKPKGYG